MDETLAKLSTGGNGMFFLVYVGSTVTPFTKSELTDLLQKSRVNNAAQDISGMLLYKDGHFMQVLEGDEGAVRSLYDKVADDPRHRGLFVLLQGTLAERQFPDWSMASVTWPPLMCSGYPAIASS